VIVEADDFDMQFLYTLNLRSRVAQYDEANGGTKPISSEVRLEGKVDRCILIESIEVIRVPPILGILVSAHGPTFVCWQSS